MRYFLIQLANEAVSYYSEKQAMDPELVERAEQLLGGHLNSDQVFAPRLFWLKQITVLRGTPHQDDQIHVL